MLVFFEHTIAYVTFVVIWLSGKPALYDPSKNIHAGHSVALLIACGLPVVAIAEAAQAVTTPWQLFGYLVLQAYVVIVLTVGIMLGLAFLREAPSHDS